MAAHNQTQGKAWEIVVKTTSIDDANLAEIDNLLADIEKANQDLKSQIYKDDSSSSSWISFFAIAAIAATAGLWAGFILSGGLI